MHPDDPRSQSAQERQRELRRINAQLIAFLEANPGHVSELMPIMTRLHQLTGEQGMDNHIRRLAPAPMQYASARIVSAAYSDAMPTRLHPPHGLHYVATHRSIQEIDAGGRIRLQVNLADYEQLTQALGRLTDQTSFSAKELQAATASGDMNRIVPSTQLYLVLRFWRHAGVVERSWSRKFSPTQEALAAGLEEYARAAHHKLQDAHL